LELLGAILIADVILVITALVTVKINIKEFKKQLVRGVTVIIIAVIYVPLILYAPKFLIPLLTRRKRRINN
jgi:Kef-type K+ transport system membrane component KefB